MGKDKTIFARVSVALKKRVDAAANQRGENSAVIIREALREYFERREQPGFIARDAPCTDPTNRLNEPSTSYKLKK